MEPMDILKKIVESDGNCTLWAKPSTCVKCPLSKLRKKHNDEYLSCVEALDVEDLTEEQADSKYKEVASRILIDKAVDDLLGEPDGIK